MAKPPFFKLLREINITFGNITLFSKLLNAVIVFLSLYLILALIKFYPLWSLVPASIYFIVDSALSVRKKHYKDVERVYPNLNEKLRTAADNVSKENPFVIELQKEVIADVKHVRVGSFVNEKNTSYKILTAVLLCFALLFTSIFNIGFDIRFLIENPSEFKYMYGGNETGSGDEVGDTRIAGEGGAEDIFGESEVAELGQELFDFSLSASGYEINLDDVKEVERKNFQELFPESDSIFVSSAVYEENIPKEQQVLVKNYFEKITQ